MPKVNLRHATHIYAQPGIATVSEAEASRLCSLGVADLAIETASEAEEAEVPETAEEPAEPVKKAKKTKKSE